MQASMTLLVPFAMGGLILLLSRRLRWLTPSGQLAAAVIGLAVALGSGWFGLALLMVFFVTSSALGRYRAGAKPARTEPEGRSAPQVLANGGVAAALSVLALAGWAHGAQYALVGAVAAAAADTWATEIGSVGSWPAWSVIDGSRVPAGRSGAVSLPGTAAAVAGAAVIGTVAALLGAVAASNGSGEPLGGAMRLLAPAPGWIPLGVLAGTAGMFADSLLGATLEDRIGWIGNDGVNLGCTLVGACVAWLLAGGG
jgi:uncharacterized protein (TIGR00297 family)